MIEDWEVRRLREARERDATADQGAFLATTCFAAGKCQWDLGCPYRPGCHSSGIDMADIDADWRRFHFPESMYDDD